MKNELENLTDPLQIPALIKLKGQHFESLLKMLELMILIRKVEEKLAIEKKSGLIVGPVHLGAGQEAVAVGVSKNLKKTDRVFSGHRSHSHLLSLNPDYYRLFAEVLGKKTGFSKGMGGSMHLYDKPNGFYGSVPIVAGTVPLAVGAAMAAKFQDTNDIGVSYFGDGAAEEGVVHESFNLAKIQNAPILFVIENNLFASHMHISLRQTSNKISRFAVANNIPYSLVDGNNVVEVANASKLLIDDIRAGKGPRIIELVTYRFYGHVDWREDVDVGVKRSVEDIKNWKMKDPISRLSNSMIKHDLWSKVKEDEYIQKIGEEIHSAWYKAMNDPYPSSDVNLKYVYSRS